MRCERVVDGKRCVEMATYYDRLKDEWQCPDHVEVVIHMRLGRRQYTKWVEVKMREDHGGNH